MGSVGLVRSGLVESSAPRATKIVRVLLGALLLELLQDLHRLGLMPRIKPLKALFVGDGKACKPPCLRIVHLDGRLQRKFGLWLAFGPVMVMVMAVLGIWGIAHHPAVRAAVNPLYGLRYLFSNGYASFLVLGGVFSVSPARRRFMPIWDISGRVRSGWPGPASFFRACSSSNRQSRPRGLRRYRAECSTPPHSRHRPHQAAMAMS